MQISDNIKDLYRRLIAIQAISKPPSDEAIETIKVDEIISILAFVYEKMRNTMDYQEDHLLRRFAIERNLKRRIVLETLKPDVARSIVEELIRSGYLANNSIPESYVPRIETIINKYGYLIELVHESVKDAGERRNIVTWLTGIMACEIDLIFAPELKDDALIETLYYIVRDRIKLKGGELSDREKNIQLYIGIHKELVRSDNAIISYHLLNVYFPDWPRADKRLVEYLASKITSVYYGIEGHINNPLRVKMVKSLKKQIVIFRVLKELVTIHENDLVRLFSNPEFLESEARKVIDKTYKRIRRKLTSSAVKAIVYIFITKVALAIALEYPYDIYIAKHVNYLALLINIAFPPLLMFLVTLSARMPGQANTKIIVEGIRNMIYGEPEKEILCELKVKKKQGSIRYFFEYFFYILLYGFIFGAIVYFLRQLQFNVLSVGIFLFFVTAVSYFGTRIRQMTVEYNVERKSESFLGFFITFFSLPILRAGLWLSFNLRRINLFTFIMDFIIEAPFKLLIELIEGWFALIREKREDTYKNT